MSEEKKPTQPENKNLTIDDLEEVAGGLPTAEDYEDGTFKYSKQAESLEEAEG